MKQYTQQELNELRKKAYESEQAFANLVRSKESGVELFKTQTAPLLFAPLVEKADEQLAKAKEQQEKQEDATKETTEVLAKVSEDVEGLRRAKEFKSQVLYYEGMSDDKLLGLKRGTDRKLGSYWFYFPLTRELFSFGDNDDDVDFAKNTGYWIYFKYPRDVVISHLRGTSFKDDLVLKCPEELIKVLFMNTTDVSDAIKDSYLQIVDYVLKDDLKQLKKNKEILNILQSNKKFTEWIRPKLRFSLTLLQLDKETNSLPKKSCYNYQSSYK